jgi:hypothetical protein
MTIPTKYIKAPMPTRSAVQYTDGELRKIEQVSSNFFKILEELIDMAAAVETGTFVVTLTGCTTSPTATAYYARSGKFVAIWIPTLRATSNTTACTVTGIPTNLLPTNTETNICYFTDNSVNLFAIAITDKALGAIKFGNQAGSLTAWTNSGLKGHNGSTFAFVLE